MPNLFCSSLGASIQACWDSGCHLVAFKSNFFIFKATLALLCNPHPPLPIEVALLQTIVFNNDNLLPKHMAKHKLLRLLIMLVYWLHVLSWSNYCISILLLLLTIACFYGITFKPIHSFIIYKRCGWGPCSAPFL